MAYELRVWNPRKPLPYDEALAELLRYLEGVVYREEDFLVTQEELDEIRAKRSKSPEESAEHTDNSILKTE